MNSHISIIERAVAPAEKLVRKVLPVKSFTDKEIRNFSINATEKDYMKFFSDKMGLMRPPFGAHVNALQQRFLGTPLGIPTRDEYARFSPEFKKKYDESREKLNTKVLEFDKLERQFRNTQILLKKDSYEEVGLEDVSEKLNSNVRKLVPELEQVEAIAKQLEAKVYSDNGAIKRRATKKDKELCDYVKDILKTFNQKLDSFLDHDNDQFSYILQERILSLRNMLLGCIDEVSGKKTEKLAPVSPKVKKTKVISNSYIATYSKTPELWARDPRAKASVEEVQEILATIKTRLKMIGKKIGFLDKRCSISQDEKMRQAAKLEEEAVKLREQRLFYRQLLKYKTNNADK